MHVVWLSEVVATSFGICVSGIYLNASISTSREVYGSAHSYLIDTFLEEYAFIAVVWNFDVAPDERSYLETRYSAVTVYFNTHVSEYISNCRLLMESACELVAAILPLSVASGIVVV